MKVTASSLIRWSGLAALVAGLIFAAIQPIHPPDVVASVTTGEWAVITRLKTAMCFLVLLGIAGIYARQVEAAGWLGLAGALLFGLSWWLQTGFVFAETFILPPLATDAPEFVDGVLGISHGRASAVDLGALPALYALVGLLYLLGGLLLGVATFRAGILPRRAAGLLAVTATLTPAAALLPHHIQRLAAVPMGVALAWLGYALWSERRAPASETSPGRTAPAGEERRGKGGGISAAPGARRTGRGDRGRVGARTRRA
jgi:hypothetical protein